MQDRGPIAPKDYPENGSRKKPLQVGTREANTIIKLGDDYHVYTFRKKKFTRLQRWLIRRCFGWQIFDIDAQK